MGQNESINLLMSGDINRDLLEDLIGHKFEVHARDIADFDRYDLVVMTTDYFEKYREQIEDFKQDSSAFTPFICLQEEEENTSHDMLQLVDDVIELPVSRDKLMSRIENQLSSKRLWDERRVLEDRYRNIFTHINDMVFLVDIIAADDISLKISEANEKLLQKLKYRQEEIRGSSPQKFLPEEDFEEFFEILQREKEALFTTVFYTAEGEEVPVEINTRRIQVHNNEQILCAARDITERKKKEARIKHLLFHDDLTGLYNRRFFEEEIKRLDAERQLPLCIFIIDINGMKIINDSYGHETGDELLIKTAELLQEIFREEDILARWGGDEFSVLLPQTGREDAEKIFTRIKERCRETENDKLPVSLGTGYAVKRETGHNIFEVLNKADSEMYQDKLTSQKSAANKIVKNLLSLLEAKSPETSAHSERMSSAARKLGKRVGLSTNQLNNLSLLATLHDIGLVNVAEEILTKPDTLTAEEWEQIKKHPRNGYKIALSCDDFSAVADEILAHHERWDGHGYPRGLKQDEIPLLARFISIIDAYDVMTHGRPYQRPVSRGEALKELEKCAGSQFDPELVRKFIEMEAG